MNRWSRLSKAQLIWVAVISLVVITLIIGLIVVFTGNDDNTGGITDTTDETSPVEDGTKVWTPNGLMDYETIQPPEPNNPEEIPIGIATSIYGGTVAEYKDNSTYSDFLIYIGGDTTRSKFFTLSPSVIVFDGSKNTTTVPSALKTGSKVRVYAMGDGVSTDHTVSVVIINDKATLLYNPISEVEVTDEGLSFYNLESRTKYHLTDESSLINAVTGLPYSKEKIKSGDKGFFYESMEQPEFVEVPVDLGTSQEEQSGDGVSTSTMLLDKESFRTINIDEAYVYPSN